MPTFLSLFSGIGGLDLAFVEWMMGFPAGWTEGMTRTQSLKALGNAVVPAQAFAALTRIRSEGDE